MKYIGEFIATHTGTTVVVYVLGYFITLYICAVHWKGELKNLNRSFWDEFGMNGPITAPGALIFIPIFWPIMPIMVASVLPAFLVVQFFKLVFHLGVYGDLTPRLAAVARRAKR